ncbi:hypothetical protein P4O66_016924 [Electrophorus voltai]|uniref:Rho GTPase activating protein 24 n=1 Tax=Electrophorus voltai TaxID=2609070 RepID=A0AAD8YWD2_9TELE|nr:hypothetical protein P4O66_016924 [Electrophorus voltai]
MHSSNHIIKFADDTTVVGLINKDNESAYREEVRELVSWCKVNNLSSVEIVKNIKFLGVHIAENLTWTLNTSSITKTAQQRLYFLQKLREAHLPSPILTTFYRSTVESILSSCIITWFGNCTVFDHKTLQRIVRTAEKIIGVSLPSITNIYITRCIRKATNIVKDATHPSHELFTLLPSGRRRWAEIGYSVVPLAVACVCICVSCAISLTRSLDSMTHVPAARIQVCRLTEVFSSISVSTPAGAIFSFSTGGDRERMTANHETYLLMASTQNDMEDWVKTIRRVIWAPFGGGESRYYRPNTSHIRVAQTVCVEGETLERRAQTVCVEGERLERRAQTVCVEGETLERRAQTVCVEGETLERRAQTVCVEGIFGQKLEETVRYERRYGNKLAPMLVEQCVDFIRHRGLKEEGLFRLPGQANLVKELQDAFDCGEKPAFNSTTDVHTVASLLKLYLRELPEPVIPFCKYDEFLACTKTLSKEQDTGMKELRRQVESLPLVNYNLLKYICRFLDEVQSYSGVNKMSVQNLATVFGPNILRPRVEDPVAIMEAGAVLVQQLMAVLIGQHGVLFPSDDGESPGTPELCNNNNNGDSPKRPTASQLQNRENNNTGPGRQCTWETPGSPGRAGQDDGSPRSGSPRNGPTPGRFELTRSPPALVKKNPAFSKGSGIVTNGSFSSSSSSSPSAEPGQDKGPAPPGAGALQTRRQGALKGPGTKMGVQNGGVRMGVSSTDVVNGTLNGRNGLWSPPGYVTLREGKGRDGEQQQHRLSTYDNVQVGGGQQTVGGGQPGAGSGSEDKQSIDSATWSTSSCEISLPDNSTSFRSSTTTCPEQDFYAAGLEDALLDGATAHDGKGTERRNSNGGGRSRGMSSSENSETAFPLSNGAANHSALHSLVASLKQEMFKQKTDYESRIKSLEHRNLELEAEMLRLHDDLEQERKKFTMVEIKLRNAERAKDDAEKRNDMLQKEMEQFFSTFGDLTADPRRPDRANTIWIQ